MRILFLYIALLCFSSSQAQETTKIRIKLLGSLSTEGQYGINIRNSSVYPSVDISEKGQPNTDQELNFAIAISDPVNVLFYSDKGKLEFFISPGDDLHMQLDMDNFRAKPTFTGKGANHAKAFADMQHIQEEIFATYSYATATPAESMKLIDQNYAAKAAYLKKNKKQVSTAFYKLSQVNNQASRLGFIMELPSQLALYQQKSKTEVVPEGYWKIAKELKLDPKMLSSSAYGGLLSYSYPIYLQNKIMHDAGRLGDNISRADGMPIRYEELNKQLKQQQLRKVSLAYVLEDYLRSSKAPASLRGTIDAYLASVGNDPVLTKAFDQLYKRYAAISQGQVPPAFSLKKEDGSSLTLADFKGKVVYIDFWASWCGPCRHEMKNGAPTLHASFKDNKDVVFLYISLDDDLQKWKQAIHDDQIEGIHVLSVGGMKSEVAQIFNIQGIPRYMIIDKEGKLFDNNAPRPSTAASQARILEALNQ